MSDEEERAWNVLRNDFTSSKLSRLHSNKKKEREKKQEDHPHTHTQMSQSFLFHFRRNRTCVSFSELCHTIQQTEATNKGKTLGREREIWNEKIEKTDVDERNCSTKSTLERLFLSNRRV